MQPAERERISHTSDLMTIIDRERRKMRQASRDYNKVLDDPIVRMDKRLTVLEEEVENEN